MKKSCGTLVRYTSVQSSNVALESSKRFAFISVADSASVWNVFPLIPALLIRMQRHSSLDEISLTRLAICALSDTSHWIGMMEPLPSEYFSATVSSFSLVRPVM